MRLHTYRDESHSRHFDLIVGKSHPWTIDLVRLSGRHYYRLVYAISRCTNADSLEYVKSAS